jgi:hypothetical protein
MQIKRLPLLTLLLLQFSFSFGQAIQNERVNTSGAEAYFKIASELGKGSDVNTISWQLLFQTIPYRMIIGTFIDTAVLKSHMQQVFSPVFDQASTPFSTEVNYHKEYKKNQKELESYKKLLHDLNVVDSVKALLNPFLPLRLQKDVLFPILFYLNYGSAEATGNSGIVLNDLLFSYKIDKFKFGLLAAHEAFHAVVFSAFDKKLKIDLDYSATDFRLLYFLQSIAEEGIADLIDKPLLLQTNSPLYNEVIQLTKDDETLSITLIKKLDSVLTLANRSEEVLFQYSGFAALASEFGKNGGHIPDRFMGNVIKKAGLLQNHMAEVEDPVSFILTYNEAINKNNLQYPFFSIESIQNLKNIKRKYWAE